MSKSQFDATNSLLGYIYQIRYSLLLSLKKMREVDDPDDYFVSIETIDDVAFEKYGSPEELLQTKYHGNPGNISNKSADIWKTIRVWIESYKNRQVSFSNTTLFLVTTQKSATGSLADLLSASGSRDVEKALCLMKSIASGTPSLKNKQGFNLFNSLSESEKKDLCDKIFIIDNSENVTEIEKKLNNLLRGTVSSSQLIPFLNRLEGKWFSIAISALENGTGRINLGQLINIIDDLREQFLPSNLPDDYSTAEIELSLFTKDDRIFLKQLELLGAGKRLIDRAILDYFRAAEQRSRWANDGLLNPGELHRYLEKLREEWDLQAGLAEAKSNLDEELSKKKLGLEIYRKCQNECALPIRPQFSESFVARGSYHHLADDLTVGWHPDFKNLLLNASGSEVA